MTFRNRFIASFLLPAIVFFSSCLGEGEEDLLYVSRINVGDRLPDFSVTTLDGETVTTSLLLAQSKTVMLVFFSTTCKDCQLQLPEIDTLVKERREDLECLCIGRNQSAEEVEDYWQRNSYSMTCASQNDDRVYKLFAENGIPRIYIANQSGIVRYVSTPEVFLSISELREILK